MSLLSEEELKEAYAWCYKLDDEEAGDFFDMALRSVARAQHAKDQEEKFNDVMAAKKSGWDDAKKFYQGDCQKRIEQVFEDLEDMGLIKEHHGHKQGEVKLVACARCTYEEYKTKTLAKEV